jgi:hypothetical protein
LTISVYGVIQQAQNETAFVHHGEDAAFGGLRAGYVFNRELGPVVQGEIGQSELHQGKGLGDRLVCQGSYFQSPHGRLRITQRLGEHEVEA